MQSGVKTIKSFKRLKLDVKNVKGAKLMLKRLLTLTVALLLALPTLALAPLTASGEEAPDLEELAVLGKDAETFAMMLRQSFHPTAIDIVCERMSQDEVIGRTRELLLRKGYVDEHIAETVCPLEDPDDKGLDIIEYYPFSEKMVSIEIWNEEVRKYFV